MNVRLRVLFVPQWYPSLENPVAGWFTRDLARAISSRHDVTVVAPPSNLAPRDDVEEGLRVIRTPVPRRAGRAGTLGRLVAVNRIAGRLEREGRAPDLIHAHSFSAGLLAVLVARRRRIPTVVSEVLSDFLTGRVLGWDAKVARFVYRHAGRVCPDSTLLEQSLVRLEPRGKYEVVPNVVDIDEFSNPPRQPRVPPVTGIVAVSSLIPRKGIAYLVEATRLLVAEGRTVSVTVIGEGPERLTLEAHAADLPVRFLGRQSRDDLVAHVRDADVFAMPSLAETFGIAAVEALAAGVPVVITSACGAAPLIAAHGGRVVPPEQPRALYEALVELLDDPNSVPGDAAARLRDYCGAEAVSQRLDAIYGSLLGVPS